MQSTVQNHLGCDDHERFTNLVFLNPWLGFLSNKTTGLKMSLKKWKKNYANCSKMHALKD